MNGPTRKTRRTIAYWMMALITMTVAWMLTPGDIGEKEQALAMVVIPSLVTGIVAFITGETANDFSERKYKVKND